VIEATLTYPLVLLCTAAVLFLAVQLYQSAVLTQTASLAADRIADTWDNSHKDVVTGAFPLGTNDGLYWRVFRDDVSDLFGKREEAVALRLPQEQGGSGMGDSLTRQKLKKTAVMLPGGLTTVLAYDNHLLDRKVTVQLNRQTLFPDFTKQWIRDDSIKAVSVSRITEPVEWIRLTDMARSFGKRLRDFLQTPEAKTAFQMNAAPKPELSINSENEARIYLMRLVNGRTVTFDTEDTGESRKIDALDPDGIAHEAKYTINQKQAGQEIMKDVELIKKGTIKGAVWHFFKNKKTGVSGLTPSLRLDLERHGILVVVHE
jgi:hypothetical protein